jgi:hypothetical protein
MTENDIDVRIAAMKGVLGKEPNEEQLAVLAGFALDLLGDFLKNVSTIAEAQSISANAHMEAVNG